MPTLYITDEFQKLPDFVAQHCHEAPAIQQASICKILAKYNGHYPNRPLLANECLAIPDDLEQQLKRSSPGVNNAGPRFTPQESQVLSKLLQQYNGDEILAISNVVDALPQNEDTSKPLPAGYWGLPERGARGTFRRCKCTTTAWWNGKMPQKNSAIKSKLTKCNQPTKNLAKSTKVKSEACLTAPLL